MGSLRVTWSHESPSSSTSHSSLARCRPRTHTCWGPGVKMGKREGSGRVGGGRQEDANRQPCARLPHPPLGHTCLQVSLMETWSLPTCSVPTPPTGAQQRCAS